MENLTSEKKKEVGSKRYMRWVLLSVAFLLAICVVCSSAYQTDLEAVEVGDVATRDYIALEDTIDEAATEKLRTAAANSVGPIYKIDTVVEQTTTQQVNDVFESLRSALLLLEEEEEFYDVVQDISLALPIQLESRYLDAFETLSRYNQIVFAENCVDVLHQIYSEGLSADELETGRDTAYIALAQTDWSGALQDMGYTIVSAAMEPNLVLDEEAMELAKEEKRNEVEDVQIRKNQKILGEGEIVTEDMYEKLLTLGLVGSGSLETNLNLIVGSILLLALTFAAVFLFFKWHPKGGVLEPKEMSMLFASFCIGTLFLWVMQNVVYYTLIPVSIFAVLVSLLIGRRLAILLNGFFAFLTCLAFYGNLEVLMYTFILGAFGAIIIQKTKNGPILWQLPLQWR